MELPIKNFKISTKKKEPNTTSKINPTILRPLQSKTPIKNIKAQNKSHTPNRNVRKIVAVKGPINMGSSSMNFERLENAANLPKITHTPLITEENNGNTKTEEDKFSAKTPKNDEAKPIDTNKAMISLYFKHKIRSLLYSIQRRELFQNMKVELGHLLTARNSRKKVKNY